jgi:hypothetical protein
VFAAEPAILVHLKLVRGVFLVFCCIVVSLLAFVASECDFNPHRGTSFIRVCCSLYQRHTLASLFGLTDFGFSSTIPLDLVFRSKNEPVCRQVKRIITQQLQCGQLFY